ncbi:MAG: BatA domain-containing protein, partial [Verrucomicrobiales bacterium]|nr:BatA domain-containing protein [Verrucomicrobiales bacterium]
MSFLTPILLAGTSAFLIPLIIHLLNRRRVIPVAWGAMHLLHEVIRQRKRRMQIEQWLLLLIRLAIPIILALALARPVLNSLRQLPGLGGSSLIILLDDSLSMQAETAEGSSALEAARAEVQRLLDDLPDGSDAQVILMADPPRAFTASARTDLTSLWQSLTDVSAERGPISPQNALTAALAAAGKAQHSAREIVLISDFQKTDWQSLADGAQLPALAAE